MLAHRDFSDSMNPSHVLVGVADVLDGLREERVHDDAGVGGDLGGVVEDDLDVALRGPILNLSVTVVDWKVVK